MKTHSRLISIGALLLFLPLFAGCSKQARFERHLKRADAYFAAREFKNAEVEYLNALRLQSTNLPAYRRLATIYYNQGKSGQALLFFQGVCVLDPKDNDARVKMGGLLLQGDAQKAREQAIHVLDQQPTNDEAILLLADAVRTPKDVQDAMQRLLRIQDQAGNQALFQLALSGLYFRQTNSQAAEMALRKAGSLQPDSPLVLKALGEFHWQHGDLTNADQAFRKATMLAPDGSRIPLRWAEFKFETGAVKEGKEILQQITQRTPDNPEAWMRLARIAFVEQNYDECGELLKKVLNLDPTNDEPRLWQARLKQVQGKPLEAIKVLEEMQRDYPRVGKISYQLALAHMQNQDLSKAAATIRQALNVDPNLTQGKLLLAELNLKQGDAASAITLLQDIIKKQPNEDRAYFLLGPAYGAQGRVNDALGVYSELEKRFPTNSNIALLRAVTLRQQNRNAEARKGFQRAIELAPNEFTAVSGLVDLDLQEKNPAAASRNLRNYLARNPPSAAAKILEARVYLAETNLNEAEIALKKAIELDPKAGPAYNLLTQIYLTTNRRPQALEQLQRTLAQNPKEVTALMLMASIYEQSGEFDKAAKSYEDVLRITPQAPRALNDLAYILSEKLGRIDEGYAHASKARDLDPQEPGIADTLGWILYRRHEYGRALPLLQESAAKVPAQAEIQFHAGMAWYMMGQEQPARVALRHALELSSSFPGREEAQARLSLLETDANAADPASIGKLQNQIKKQPDDLPALLRLGRAYERTGAPDKARQAYEDARTANSNSVPALIQLAQFYSASLKDSKQALALAREARKLAPEDPQIAHVLGRLAYEQGDPAWASSLLQQSAQKVPNDPEILYDLAHAWYSVGRLTEAEQTMLRARQTGANFGHDQEAQWFLALIDYYRNPAKRLASEAQVNQLLKARPDYLPALMVAAMLLEQQGRIPDSRQAFEKILDRNPLFAPARKQLAGLYTDRLSDQQKAQEYAAKAREVLNDDPELVKILGKIACRREDYRNAVRFLQESSQKLPGDAETLFFLGKAHNGLKEKSASKQALDQALALAPDASFAPEARKILAGLK